MRRLSHFSVREYSSRGRIETHLANKQLMVESKNSTNVKRKISYKDKRTISGMVLVVVDD